MEILHQIQLGIALAEYWQTLTRRVAPGHHANTSSASKSNGSSVILAIGTQQAISFFCLMLLTS